MSLLTDAPQPLIHIVIAHYRESLDWLSELTENGTSIPANIRIFVYHKGGGEEPADWMRMASGTGGRTRFHWIPRENVGRESDTWLHHILEHYAEFAGAAGAGATGAAAAVFLQGNPLDHTDPQLLPPPQRLDYEQLARILSIAFQPRIAFPIPFFKQYYREYGHPFPGLHEAPHFRRLFAADAAVPDGFLFAPGAQYVVLARAIVGRPREFYQDLYDGIHRSQHLTHDITHAHPVPYNPAVIDPWTIERLWAYIWNPDEYPTATGAGAGAGI